MALNLKKGEEENSVTPSAKKMGLNLSKTDNSPKSNLNLSKDVTRKEDDLITSSDQFVEKKKFPIAYILVAVLIFGFLGYYFMTKDGVNSNVSPVSVDSTSIDSPRTTTEQSQSQSQGEITNLPSANESTVSTTNSNDNQKATSSTPPSTNNESAPAETNSQNSTNSSASVEQKAREVIAGKFGNGADRKLALGSDYTAIQAKVNALYRSRKQ
jgi:preprotein translocase subunit SecF